MITAKIIQDSISYSGTRIITMELEYPRFIHAEFMTHRMLSKNSASSRAIPVDTMISFIDANPAMPEYWGKNQPGMSAKEELDGVLKSLAAALWTQASKAAISFARLLNTIGVHKQLTNRVIEPWQTIKVVCTATEWENFFWLRNHSDAQPEIKVLAECMLEAMTTSEPFFLHHNEWHVPYVSRLRNKDTGKLLYVVSGEEIEVETAKIISASSCAQVSYRKSDTSQEKAEVIFGRLIHSVPVHASPVEHQATPIEFPNVQLKNAEYGVTHKCVNGYLWSGNFKDWIQFRKLISNESKKG